MPDRGVTSVLGWMAYCAGSAVRYALAAVILFLGVHLVYVLLQGLREPEGAEAFIRLDPLPEVVREETLSVSGRYLPFSLIQVQVNERLERVTYTGADGRFQTQVQLPRQVSFLRLVPVREDRLLVDQSAQTRIHRTGDPLLAPEVQSVLRSPSGRLLLGFADALVTLELLDREQKEVATGFTEDSGVYSLEVAEEVYRQPAGYTLRAVAYQGGRKENRLELSVALAGAREESIARSVVVDLSRSGRKIELNLQASRRLPHVSRLLAGDIDDGRFLSALFGGLVLPPAEKPRRELTIDAEGRANLHWVARLTEGVSAGRTLEVAGLLGEEDSFTVVWDQPAPTWFSPLPGVAETQRAVWKGPQKEIRVGFSPELAAPPPERKPEERREPLSVREILSNLRFPLATAVAARAALSLIPFAWILWLIRKHPWFLESEAARSRLATVCLALGVMCVWYGVYQLANLPAFRFSRLWQYTGRAPNDLPLWACWLAALATLPLAVRLGDRQRDRWVEQVRLDSGGRIPFLRPWRWVMAAALAGAAFWLVRSVSDWQALLDTLDLDQQVVSATKSYARIFPPGTAPAALAVFLGVLVFGGPGLALSLACVTAVALAAGLVPALGWSRGTIQTRLLAGGMCVVLLFQWVVPARALWPRRALGGRPWRRFLLLLAGLVAYFVFTSPKWGLWLAGGIAVWVVVWLTVYLRGQTAGRTALLPAAVSAVVCFPAFVPEVSNSLTAGLFPLMVQLDRFLPYIPLLAVVGWLARRRGAAEQDMILGPVLVALYLLGASARIFYIPVPLIAGYLLARYWLFRPPDGRLEENLSGAGRAQRIKELMDWRWTSRMTRVFRRAQDKKLEKGEITFEQHRRLMEGLQAGAGEAPNPRELALAAGPTGHPWWDAVIAVRYGLPLALPWMALSLYQFVASRQDLAFPLPHFAIEVVVALVRWLAIAFVFGYFYRYLRGSSGLSKGLALWAAIVTPYLLFRLLLTEPLATMQYFFYWAGQVFVFCTVLGLAAFDYETLRRHGYSWRHLTALHNAPALSALGSSLAAVLIPALVALFQGKVADLMKFVVGSVLPKLPPAGP